MAIIEIILVSFGLAADAFAASICKGLSLKKITFKSALIVGIWFGFFQGAMPVLGYFLGNSFEKIITNVDHWVAFLLLIFIGGNMIRESFNKEEVETNSLSFKSMLTMAVATSIDALAFGIAYVCAYGSKNSVVCFIMIGVITCITSMIGVKIGNKFGNKYEKAAKITGGIILILLGSKILLEHLNII